MYHFIKKCLKSVIPKKILFNIEPYLRILFSFLKGGKNHLCEICNFKNQNWIRTKSQNLLCPRCGSLDRDRRLWKILNKSIIKDNITILDFSPSRVLYRKWKKIKTVSYKSTDFEGDFISDYKYDITSINENNDTFDLIICYHILEHIENDNKAMAELYRVLKPNGILIIQTPFKEGETYENETIKTPEDRLTHFGQEDHVRIYSVSNLKVRLENCNFIVEINTYNGDPFLGLKHNETIIYARKKQ